MRTDTAQIFMKRVSFLFKIGGFESRLLRNVTPPFITQMHNPEVYELKIEGRGIGMTHHMGRSIKEVLEGWTKDHINLSEMFRVHRGTGFNFAHEAERTTERLQEIAGVSKFCFIGPAEPVPEFSFGLEVDIPYCMRAVLLRPGSRRCAYD